MNSFDQKLQESGHYPLTVERVDTFVANFGLRRNIKSMYYYSEAPPGRMKEVPLEIVEKLLRILKENSEISKVEITGTSPESNPYFKYFVTSAVNMGKKLAVVSNPAVYSEPGMEYIPAFLAENKVKILAFLPHYDENEVDRLMGKGTFSKIISAFKKLNKFGYGQEGNDLTIAVVFFPAEPELAPDKDVAEEAFRKSYQEIHGIDFNHFITFNNIPVGRFRQSKYMNSLEAQFNPGTVKNLPCKHAVSVSPDGRFFDCDFLVAADRPVKCRSTNLDNFDYALLNSKEIATSDLCFICTAGGGATCAECFT